MQTIVFSIYITPKKGDILQHSFAIEHDSMTRERATKDSVLPLDGSNRHYQLEDGSIVIAERQVSREVESANTRTNFRR